MIREKQKKGVLLKRLKIVENKNEQQLEAIREEEEKQLDVIGKYRTDRTEKKFYDNKNKKAVELSKRNNKIIQDNKNKSFVCTHSDEAQYDFNQYRDINQFGRDIYSGELSIKDAENEQYEMQILINRLNGYGATNTRKIESRKKVLENARRPHTIRNEIIEAFKDGIF